MQYEVHGPWRSVILGYTKATCEHALGSHSAQGPYAWRCFPRDKTYRSDKKLKWYACQGDIAIMYHYPAENLYLFFDEDSSLPLDKSEQDGGSYFYAYRLCALSISAY